MNVIADFIGQVVQVFYAFTGDYGIAIVMITLAIKLLLLPLNIKQRAQLEKQKEVMATLRHHYPRRFQRNCSTRR